MTVARVLLLALLTCGALAAPAAQAAFERPVEIGSGQFPMGVAAATDALGGTTAVLTGGASLQVVARASSAAAWSPPAPLPGKALGRAVGPVVSAAGPGAAAVAWRIDTPRRYQAIAAMARGAGEAFGDPVVVSGVDANGVRHPAIAVDGEGRTVLAYNTNTRLVHLSLKGPIAISLRGRGGAFATPRVVDEHPASAPAVAIGPDGRGLVTWLRQRRIWAVSVDAAAGTIGRVKALTGSGSYAAPRVAAGPGGAATVAFPARRQDPRTHGSIGADVAVLRRTGGGTFPSRPQVVGAVGRRGFLRDVAIAADEAGQTTVAWSPENFGGGPNTGVNGVTSGVRAVVAAADAGRFGRPHEIQKRAGLLCGAPAVAATAGRSVVAYECHDRDSWVVRAATLDGDRGQPAATAMSASLDPRYYYNSASVSAGIDDHGITTVIGVAADQGTPTPTASPVQRVLAATGR